MFSSETNVFPNPRLLLSSASGKEMGTNRGEKLVKQFFRRERNQEFSFGPKKFEMPVRYPRRRAECTDRLEVGLGTSQDPPKQCKGETKNWHPLHGNKL